MITHKDHFHGSDLEKIESVYGIKKEDILSFSANVNPLGISPLVREQISSHIDVIASYPDREYTTLRTAIANYVHTERDRIIVGNGSTELISLFVDITRPKKALILGPTYSEYEREVSLVGGRCSYYPLRNDSHFNLDIDNFCSKLSDDIDLVIICNPNNPTSGCITKREMRQILDVCKQHAIYVMVDETYVEFVKHPEEISSVSLTEYYNNIIILRGTSKFFSAPGLRLGYAITGNYDLVKEITQHKNPWMVGSLAEAAGEIMFSDTDYIEKTRELIDRERDRMYDLYSESDRFIPYAPSANFLLLEITEDGVTSRMLFDKAIQNRMMIRDCSTFPFLGDKYIRICFMNPEDNDRLFRVLTN